MRNVFLSFVLLGSFSLNPAPGIIGWGFCEGAVPVFLEPNYQAYYPPSPVYEVVCLPEPIGVYAGGAFLWWRMDMVGMSFVGIEDSPPSSTTILNGNLEEVKTKYSPGYRAWIGYEFGEGDCNVEAEYTRYTTSASTTVARPSNGFLVGTFTNYVNNTIVQASSKFTFEYNTGRILLGKEVKLSRNYHLRLRTGIQGLNFSQDWLVIYNNDSGNSNTIKNNWEYKGGGIVLGFDSQYDLGCGFGFFIDGSAAAYYGRYKLLSFMQPSVLSYSFQNTRIRENRVAESMQIIAGFNWEDDFGCCTAKLRIGYELNSYFNLQEQYRVNLAGGGSLIENEKVSNRYNTALSVQGLTVALSLSF